MRFRLWYIFLVLGAAALAAADQEILVRPGETDHFEADPGQSVTAVFTVTNKTGSSKDFIGTVQLPDGWKLITREYPFTLSSQQQDLRLVSILVPNNCASGLYSVTYRVMGRQHPELSDEHTVTVRVTSVKKITLEILQKPEYVFAGNTYSVVFLVTNRSNASADLQFSAKTREAYPVDVTPFSGHLATSESKKVSVTVTTDSTIETNFIQRLNFKAVFAQETKHAFRAVANIEVLPLAQKKRAGYHLFPIKAGVSHGMQRNSSEQSGTQYFIEGEGIIKDGTDRFMKFRLKGPDVYGKSIFFQHDEYFMYYKTGPYSVHLGDKTFNCTPLLEKFRYGRGVEGSFRKKQFTFGGYMFRTRWLNPRETQRALYGSYSFSTDTRVKLSVLNKAGRPRHGTIMSVRAEADKVAGSSVKAEFASDMNTTSYEFNIVGRRPSLFYSVQVIGAGKDFAGYYSDTRFFSSSLVYDVSEDIKVMGYYRQEHQNFEIDTTSYAAPFSRYGKMNVSWKISGRSKVFGDMVYRSRTDRMPVPLFDYSENSFRIGAWYTIYPVNITASLETGKTRNHLAGGEDFMYRYNASLNIQPSDNFSVRGYAYYDINNRYSRERQKRVTYGVNIRYKAGARTGFRFNYQNNYSPEEYYRNRDLFETGLEHKLCNGHLFTAKARYTLLRNTLDMRETSLLFSYVIPYAVPLGRKQSMGMVRGRVYTAREGGPVQGVILRMGKSVAVSDKNGNFSFPPVIPGEYYLSADRSNLAMNSVFEQKVPKKLTVHGGQDVIIALGMTESGTIKGSVELYSTAPDTSAAYQSVQKGVDRTRMETGFGQKLYKAGGVAGIIIELKRGDETRRWFSDEYGRFVFEGLRPGSWELRVLDANIPENFQVETPVLQIDLQPAAEKDVHIRVVPRKRRIKMLQQGGVLQEDSSE